MNRKADGSSKGGVGDSRRGKCGLTKVRDWKDEKLKKIPDPKLTDVKIEGITRSKGLILMAEFEVCNPLKCDIPKWKSAQYTLKIRDSNREIARGKVPSKWLRANRTTTVKVTINVSLIDLGDNLQRMILQAVIDGVLKLELALKITFGIPIIGEFPLNPPDIPINLEVSPVLENCLGTNLYKAVQVVLDAIQGNKNVFQAISQVFSIAQQAQISHDNPKMKARHGADDLKIKWEHLESTIKETVQATDKFWASHDTTKDNYLKERRESIKGTIKKIGETADNFLKKNPSH